MAKPGRSKGTTDRLHPLQEIISLAQRQEGGQAAIEGGKPRHSRNSTPAAEGLQQPLTSVLPKSSKVMECILVFPQDGPQVTVSLGVHMSGL